MDRVYPLVSTEVSVSLLEPVLVLKYIFTICRIIEIKFRQ